ncbi:MAG: hypothetical protein RR922_06095 [Clostridia bacterium]
MLKKICIVILILANISHISAEEISIDSFVKAIDEYTKTEDILNIKEVAKDLEKGKGIDIKEICGKLVGSLFKEVKIAFKNMYLIFVIVIIMSIIKFMQLGEDDSVKKISYIACTMLISTVCIATFLEILKLFEARVSLLTSMLQVAVPILMTLLIVTGGISSAGIATPLILFAVQCIGAVVSNIIVPLSIISLSFNVINSVNTNINLGSLSKILNKASLWILGVMLTAFLCVFALETNISVSIDGVAGKTLQSASSAVPVVGKFVADSLGAVIGSFVVIKKVAGTLTILVILSVTMLPVFKIVSVILMFTLLISISSVVIGEDKKIIGLLEKFLDTYKLLLGVLIGIIVLFVISLAIIMNLSGNIHM